MIKVLFLQSVWFKGSTNFSLKICLNDELSNNNFISLYVPFCYRKHFLISEKIKNSFTCIYFFLLRKLRSHNPAKILINLCIAIAATDLIFLAGQQEYALQSDVGCKVNKQCNQDQVSPVHRTSRFTGGGGGLVLANNSLCSNKLNNDVQKLCISLNPILTLYL